MKLKEKQIREAGPGPTPYKIPDGHGLYLLVTPSGGKLWRYDYRFEGKKQTMTLGKFPIVLLMDARHRHLTARKLLADGVNPMAQRAKKKAEIAAEKQFTLEVVAREWFAAWQPGKADSHSSKVARLLERDIFPLLGKKPIAQVTAVDVVKTANSIISRGAIETGHRSVNVIGQVMRYAAVRGYAERDITPGIRSTLPKAHRKHFAATTDPKRLSEILRAFDTYHGSFRVRTALRLMPLVFVRPLTLRNAKWADINFEKAEWRPPVRPNQKVPAVVPLAKQALALFRGMLAHTGAGIYVFPSQRRNDKAMSDNAVLVAMRELGIAKEEMTGHGFRAVARTLLRETLEFPTELIEMQLGHDVADMHGRAYNRTEFLVKRYVMMQTWADYLDALKKAK